jgi:hypothetical protein
MFKLKSKKLIATLVAVFTLVSVFAITASAYTTHYLNYDLPVNSSDSSEELYPYSRIEANASSTSGSTDVTLKIRRFLPDGSITTPASKGIPWNTSVSNLVYYKPNPDNAMYYKISITTSYYAAAGVAVAYVY